MATATETANFTTENLKNKASEAASNVADKAKQAAGTFGSKASEAASNVADKAKQAASAVGHKAEDATHAMGSGIKSFGETMRQKGPQEGVLGSATSSVADCLESSGQYLEKEGLQGIADDMTNLIRRNPIPAILVGVGLGFLLARVTMRR
jgi:hypothetical protein